MTNSNLPIADIILNKLAELGAYTGDQDVRMAIEISSLVKEEDAANLSVSIVDNEVVISFKTVADKMDHLLPVAQSCGYEVSAVGEHGRTTLTRPVTSVVLDIDPDLAEKIVKAGFSAVGEAAAKAQAQKDEAVKPRPFGDTKAATDEPLPKAKAWEPVAAKSSPWYTSSTVVGVGVTVAVAGLGVWGLNKLGVKLPFLSSESEPAIAEPVAAFINWMR